MSRSTKSSLSIIERTGANPCSRSQQVYTDTAHLQAGKPKHPSSIVHCASLRSIIDFNGGRFVCMGLYGNHSNLERARKGLPRHTYVNYRTNRGKPLQFVLNKFTQTPHTCKQANQSIHPPSCTAHHCAALSTLMGVGLCACVYMESFEPRKSSKGTPKTHV